MPDATTNSSVPSVQQTDANTGWMSDVQRAIALLLVGVLVFATGGLVIRLVISADTASILDLTKTMLAQLGNMALIALGFFFGNTMAKMTQDAGQQKVVEKLTSPPPNGPVAPVPSPAAPIVVVSWWSLMEPAEKTAIEAAAKTDPKIKTALDALQSGNAEAPHLADLVTAGLLTQARADAITKKV